MANVSNAHSQDAKNVNILNKTLTEKLIEFKSVKNVNLATNLIMDNVLNVKIQIA